MRICIFDNWLKKFSYVLEDHWKEQGHTVIYEPGYNPELVKTCDRVFFESADTSVHLAEQQKPNKKGKIFVRIVDIDAHCNGPAGLQPGYFDGIIYIAEHIKDMCETRHGQLAKINNKVIQMGVDLDKYTFSDNRDGYDIAFIANHLSPQKGYDMALIVLTELLKKNKQWKLHVVGKLFGNSVWESHINHIIKNNNLSGHIEFYGQLPNQTGNEINDFLEDKNYLLACSHKEAFSFVVAEAMSKGLKVVAYDFWGAGKIWPDSILYKTENEAVKLFEEDVYTPDLHRKYIEDNYPLEKHLKEINEFMEIPS